MKNNTFSINRLTFFILSSNQPVLANPLMSSPLGKSGPLLEEADIQLSLLCIKSNCCWDYTHTKYIWISKNTKHTNWQPIIQQDHQRWMSSTEITKSTWSYYGEHSGLKIFIRWTLHKQFPDGSLTSPHFEAGVWTLNTFPLLSSSSSFSPWYYHWWGGYIQLFLPL